MLFERSAPLERRIRSSTCQKAPACCKVTLIRQANSIRQEGISPFLLAPLLGKSGWGPSGGITARRAEERRILAPLHEQNRKDRSHGRFK